VTLKTGLINDAENSALPFHNITGFTV